jgi:hypothetical protein
MAAALALVIWLPRSGGGTTQLKGAGDHATLFVEHGGVVRRAEAGERVAPGDRLQIALTTHEPRYVALLGSDATGARFTYFADGERAARIDPGVDLPLPSSVVLDATRGREALIVVFCDRAATIAELQVAVPAGCSAETFEVEKP